MDITSIQSKKKYVSSNNKTKKKNKLILFIHIPKAAGTTIEEILYQNNYKDSLCQVALKHISTNQLLDKRHLKMNQVSKYHIPLSFFRKAYQTLLRENYNLFAVVRNPYARIISDFRFWISQFYPTHNGSSRKQFQNLCKQIKEIIPDLSLSVENLNKYIHTVLDPNYYSFSRLDGHLIPMYYYTHLKNKSGYLYPCCQILRMETLNEDFNNFINKKQLKIPLDLTTRIAENKSKGLNFTYQDLDRHSIELIQGRYARDFKLFKYTM